MRLIDKIRKARETGVEIEGHAFTIRRPTDEEAQRFARDNASVLEIVNIESTVSGKTELLNPPVLRAGAGVEKAIKTWRDMFFSADAT